MMVTSSETIADTLEHINNNKYVMPAFQRYYEWDLDRIEKLWDSILQGYPFSTFLFWELDANHVTRDNLFYIFARECNFKKNGQNKKVQYAKGNIDFSQENHPTIAVLDGQQRLTSLFLSLYGSPYREPNKRSARTLLKLYLELDGSKLGEGNMDSTKKYGIYFSDKVVFSPSPSLFDMKNILKEEFKSPDTREIIIEEIVSRINERQRDYARDTLNRLCAAFYDQRLVVYTKISELYQDDAVEMFVRFNSGGKPLSKSQVSMSILEVNWPNVQTDFGNLLSGKYANFGTDFILRTAHMIYGDVIKSNIDSAFASTFKSDYQNFKSALDKTEEMFDMYGYDLSKFSSKWNIVIPIIYLIYNNPSYEECYEGMFAYLFRAMLFNYYSSGTTGKLQKMKTLILQNNFKLSPEMFELDEELRVTQTRLEDLMFAEKDSPTTGNVLECLGVNYIQEGYDYDRDHIHPARRFGSSAPLGMSDNDWALAKSLYNKLPNIQYLEYDKNRSKGETDFDTYFLALNPTEKAKMKEEGFIPNPPTGTSETQYYNLSNFLNFFNDRKQLLISKLTELLYGRK